jgi:membrane protein YqaA with SNARE-associated domain
MTSQQTDEMITKTDVDNQSSSSKTVSIGPFKRAWKWATKDKETIGSLVFIFLFIVLVVVLAALGLDLGQIMQNIVNWFELKVGKIGIFLGVMIISIFGNFTVIFPVPYVFALVTVAIKPSITIFDVIIMGIFAGIGASVGETSAWFLGKASKNVIEGSMNKQIARAQNWIDKGLAPLIIFLFAATPLPDDAVLVFIGLLGYALWKTLIWCFLGKVALTTFVGLFAKLLGDTRFGGTVLWLFGLESSGGSYIERPTPVWLSAITWIATMLVIGVVLFVDWKQLWDSMTRSFTKQKYRTLVLTSDLSEEMTAFDQSAKSKQVVQNKKHFYTKEESFWQCVVKVKEDDYPDYFDFYTIPFVVGQKKEINMPNNWQQMVQENITNERYANFCRYFLEKVIPPEGHQNKDGEQLKEQLATNYHIISLAARHPVNNKKFRLKFLFQVLDEQTLQLKAIGEKEALIVKKIKSVPKDLILDKLLQLLDQMAEKPESVEKVAITRWS